MKNDDSKRCDLILLFLGKGFRVRTTSPTCLWEWWSSLPNPSLGCPSLNYKLNCMSIPFCVNLRVCWWSSSSWLQGTKGRPKRRKKIVSFLKECVVSSGLSTSMKNCVYKKNKRMKGNTHDVWVTFKARVFKPNLTLLKWPVSVSCVSDLLLMNVVCNINEENRIYDKNVKSGILEHICWQSDSRTLLPQIHDSVCERVHPIQTWTFDPDELSAS